MVQRRRNIFTLDRLNWPGATFFTFLSYLKTSDLHLVPEDFYKK